MEGRWLDERRIGCGGSVELGMSWEGTQGWLGEWCIFLESTINDICSFDSEGV